MRQSKNRKHTSEEEYDITRSMLKTMRRSLNEEVEDGIYKLDKSFFIGHEPYLDANKINPLSI